MNEDAALNEIIHWAAESFNTTMENAVELDRLLAIENDELIELPSGFSTVGINNSSIDINDAFMKEFVSVIGNSKIEFGGVNVFNKNEFIESHFKHLNAYVSNGNICTSVRYIDKNVKMHFTFNLILLGKTLQQYIMIIADYFGDEFDEYHLELHDDYVMYKNTKLLKLIFKQNRTIPKNTLIDGIIAAHLKDSPLILLQTNAPAKETKQLYNFNV